MKDKIEAIMEEAEIQLYDNGDSGASDMSNLRAILEKHLQEPTEERDKLKYHKIRCTQCGNRMKHYYWG